MAAMLLLAPLAWLGIASGRLSEFLGNGRYLQALIFTSVFAFTLAGVVVLPFLRSTIIRAPLVILFMLGFIIDRSLNLALGTPMKPETFELFWRERAMSLEAANAYGHYVLIAMLFVVPIGLVFLLPPRGASGLSNKWAILPIASYLMVAALVVRTVGQTREFPSGFSLPANVIFAAATSLYEGPREAPSHNGPLVKPLVSRIIFIVDESVRGDYLGINDAKRKTTPHLNSITDRLINFGVAASGGNCSAESRLMLRTGLRPNALPDPGQKSLKIPTIWQFARQAGFKSTYINAWVSALGTNEHSYMNKAERTLIDQIIPVGDKPIYNRDYKIAALIPELLSAQGLQFLYVDKLGTHFPYSINYDPDFSRALIGRVPRDTLNDRDELIANYEVAIRWTVDGFFERLLPQLVLTDALLIYTSDHGQGLIDNGERWLHCSGERAAPGEGMVPLFALTDNAELSRRLKASAAAGSFSHFQIFPTLLEAMGLPPAWIKEHYGDGLLDNERGTRRLFFTGDMFGRHPSNWVRID